MIDPNERYTFIDKNWNKGKSWMDSNAKYWSLNRNIDQSAVRKINEGLHAGDGKIVREATKEELAKLVAP